MSTVSGRFDLGTIRGSGYPPRIVELTDREKAVELTDREKALLITALVAWWSEGCFDAMHDTLIGGKIDEGEFPKLFEKLGASDLLVRRKIRRRSGRTTYTKIT